MKFWTKSITVWTCEKLRDQEFKIQLNRRVNKAVGTNQLQTAKAVKFSQLSGSQVLTSLVKSLMLSKLQIKLDQQLKWLHFSRTLEWWTETQELAQLLNPNGRHSTLNLNNLPIKWSIICKDKLLMKKTRELHLKTASQCWIWTRLKSEQSPTTNHAVHAD